MTKPFSITHMSGAARIETLTDYPSGVKTITPYTGEVYREEFSKSSVDGDHVTPNPFSWSWVKARPVYGESSYHPAHAARYDNSGLIEFYADDLHYIDPGSDPNLYNRALDDFYEKLRGGVDISIDFAQAGQTHRMFKAVDRVEQLTKGFTRKLKGATNLVSSLYLEYTYGLAPLVQTVYDCALLMLYKSMRPIRVVGKAKNEIDTSKYLPFTTQFNGTDPKGKFVTVKGFEGVKIYVWVTTNPLEAQNFTSMNPLSIGWELLPYSFVVDWFYDMGGYLRNWESAIASGGRFNHGCVSTLKHYVREANVLAVYPDGNASGYGFCYEKSFVRTKLLAMPVPQPPQFYADLGSKRLLNAAALLGSLLGRNPNYIPKNRDVYWRT